MVVTGWEDDFGAVESCSRGGMGKPDVGGMVSVGGMEGEDMSMFSCWGGLLNISNSELGDGC